MQKKATLLLPLKYNDGSTIPPKTLVAIQDEIFVTFKGWTLVGEVEGAYQMQAGDKKVERL